MYTLDLRKTSIANAAGMVKTRLQTLSLLRSGATRGTLGSITRLSRSGNRGTTYYFDEKTGASYNALGLSNGGVEDTLTWLPEVKKKYEALDRELSVSVAGFAPAEYATLAGMLVPYCHRIELNVGCPNVWGEKGQKPIASYQPELLHEILSAVRAEIGGDQHLSVKISPVEENILQKIAPVIAESDLIDEVVAVNTLPNQRAVGANGKETLRFISEETAEEIRHVGGMGGAPLKSRGIRTVAMLRELLPRNIGIIGVGGISTGADMIDYLKAGASGVQVGTAFFERGERIFSEILLDASNLLETAA